jgi:hypothetical protein
LELYVAIICACLPSLRPLLTLSVSHIKAWTTGGGGSKSRGFSELGPSDHRTMNSSGKKKLLSDDGYSLQNIEAAHLKKASL